MNKIKKVFIVDDHPLIRKGLSNVLAPDPNIEVVGEADCGELALELYDKLKPDIFLLDINLPGISGIETGSEIKKIDQNTEIIFLTMLNDEDIFNCALDIGAGAFLLKDTAIDEITNAIEMVSRGDFYLSQSISHFFINRKKAIAEFNTSNNNLKSLTLKEKEIIKLIALGNTSRDIADHLTISINTVENHRSNICKKLSLSGSNSLLKFAIENKSKF